MAALPNRTLRALCAIAACGTALGIGGCDGDGLEPEARSAKLWDTNFVEPPATLPDMVQSVIASGDEGFAPMPSALSKLETDDRDPAAAMRTPLVEDAPMPALARSAESLAQAGSDTLPALGSTDEEPRYAWLLDSTSPADN